MFKKPQKTDLEKTLSPIDIGQILVLLLRGINVKKKGKPRQLKTWHSRVCINMNMTITF